MASTLIKKNFRCTPAFQQFYTGGPFAVSSDGSFMACAYNDQIQIVNTSDSSILSTLEGDTELVTALTLSPDDKHLYSASHSRQIRVWDLSSFTCQRSWKGHDGPVMGMVCDSSGGLLATAGSDRKVLVWDISGGYCTHFFQGHKGIVTTVVFHPDPQNLILFSGSDDATVRVWNLDSKKCIAVLEKHFSSVTSLGISENGSTLLSAGRDKVVNLWNLPNYSFRMTVPSYEVLEAVCVINPGTALAAALDQSQLSIMKKKGTGSTPIFFLTAGERGILRIWSSEGGICLYEQQASDAVISSSEEEPKLGFTSAVILPSNQGLLCVTADQQFLFYSPTHSEEMKFHLNLTKRLIGYNEEIVDLKFMGVDEQYLAVATNLEQVRVYDLQSMACSYVLSGHTEPVLCLDTCVSSSGKTLLVSGSKDNSIRVWEEENRCCIGLATGHMGAVGAVAFSKKRKNFIVSGSSDHAIKLWSLDGLSDRCNEVVKLQTKAVVAAHKKDINALAVAPDDSLVCSGSQDRTACLWRLPDLVLVVELKGHKRGIWSVEFSPVDKCVMTASGDKTIKIWSVSNGSCLKTFEGHPSGVLRASFLSRGAQFVSSDADGLLKLWTIKSNECVATFDQHENKVWALSVGRKTEMLATGGGDGAINLWHDCTAEDKVEALQKEEEETLKGQELENALCDSNYLKAIRLAFEMRRPHKLLSLFEQLCRKEDGGDQIEKAFQGLRKEEFCVLLEYIREWDTKPKFCHIAHFVLFRVFNILPPTEIVEMKGISELLEGLIPYSERHFRRMDRFARSTFLLDYTLSQMLVISPEEEMAFPKREILPNQPSKNDRVFEEAKAYDEQSKNDQETLQSAVQETVENGYQEKIDNGTADIDEPLQNDSSKKRKSRKLRAKVLEKRAKVAYVEVSHISSKA
ncbi:transducin beta-like protein 3 [Amborella trichopoda]|uniref:U3 small nucleolar RNA-associated protein 13 C-terminal domain-containing protein n=1 Tax=Amborella trichopoda TaxID=13333 RepID=U5CZA4_AMBTC|nr:transducin beta-like protein 3 [Amborella trichopoda]ERN15499.1 hypothetical protein AMTR_s00048p00053570 [Amborella trichopoda]|eukprot:XP_006854032.1 transducin beta-like protein 3 [Amborella trichopoda]